MIWVAAISVAILIGFGLRILCGLKMKVLRIQSKYQRKFFDLAHEISGWESVSDQRLATLAELSLDLQSRKTQLIVIDSIRQSAKNEARGDGSVSRRSTDDAYADLTKEQRHIWLRMYLNWIIAVCAQGSFVGFGGLIKTLEYFDPDDREQVEIVSRLNARLAH